MPKRTGRPGEYSALAGGPSVTAGPVAALTNRWLLQRVLRARERLATAHLTVGQVAGRSGLGSGNRSAST
ncbi:MULTISPECIES: hypothetical protein [unclassified Streptomyces]|uniref:hypothetical protein n=1 Tax=unclassified Streptomyces TaxID=2593676 RepID=UPI0033185911